MGTTITIDFDHPAHHDHHDHPVNDDIQGWQHVKAPDLQPPLLSSPLSIAMATNRYSHHNHDDDNDDHDDHHNSNSCCKCYIDPSISDRHDHHHHDNDDNGLPANSRWWRLIRAPSTRTSRASVLAAAQVEEWHLQVTITITITIINTTIIITTIFIFVFILIVNVFIIIFRMTKIKKIQPSSQYLGSLQRPRPNRSHRG